ncbi:MAG: hypothetical protein LLG14_19555 [Nocardiaceae bacterium]|nr:hypothetical protein [Nocardiaceae bacterium]
MFDNDGPHEEDANLPTMREWLEVEPGQFKPVQECTLDELTARFNSLMLQARALLDEAEVLRRYIEKRS